MKSIALIFTLVSISVCVQGQDYISWQEDSPLSLATLNCTISGNLDSSYFKSKMYPKLNFEKRKLSVWLRKHSNRRFETVLELDETIIIADDTVRANQLFSLLLFQFDLVEYYSRMLRKNGFDSSQFLVDPDQTGKLMNELGDKIEIEIERVFEITDYGRNEGILNNEQKKLNMELYKLSNFCFDCSPN